MSDLACPVCGGALKRDGRGVDHLLLCRTCGPFPVLGGVAILVANPAEWCAVHADAALASLAEVNRASPSAVAILESFKSLAAHVMPAPFGDDWTRAEREATRPPRWHEGPAREALDELTSISQAQSPAEWLLHRLPTGKRVLELGPGAGSLTSEISRVSKRVTVGDTSLRAVLNAVGRAEQQVTAAVMSAEAIALKSRSVDVVVAENVVDLLGEPEAFLEGARRVLTAKGRLLLTTPEPELGTDDERKLEHLAQDAGFSLVEKTDGLPWLRVHTSRRAEVYLVQACVFVRR